MQPHRRERARRHRSAGPRRVARPRAVDHGDDRGRRAGSDGTADRVGGARDAGAPFEPGRLVFSGDDIGVRVVEGGTPPAPTAGAVTSGGTTAGATTAGATTAGARGPQVGPGSGAAHVSTGQSWRRPSPRRRLDDAGAVVLVAGLRHGGARAAHRLGGPGAHHHGPSRSPPTCSAAPRRRSASARAGRCASSRHPGPATRRVPGPDDRPSVRLP